MVIVEENILVLGEDPTQGLDNVSITAEAIILLIIQDHKKKLCLSLHYNGSNSFLFVYATKIHWFKSKDSETIKYRFWLRNILKDFSVKTWKNPIKWVC